MFVVDIWLYDDFARVPRTLASLLSDSRVVTATVATIAVGRTLHIEPVGKAAVPAAAGVEDGIHVP